MPQFLSFLFIITRQLQIRATVLVWRKKGLILVQDIIHSIYTGNGRRIESGLPGDLEGNCLKVELACPHHGGKFIFLYICCVFVGKKRV